MIRLIWIEGKQVLLWSKFAAQKEVGVSNLNYWINKGSIPAPSYTWRERKYYTEADIQAIQKTMDRIKEVAGMCSKTSLADKVGMPRTVFEYHIKKKNIPSPSIDGRYYTEKEAVEILDFFKTYHRAKKGLYLMRPGLKLIGAKDNEIEWINLRRDDLPLQPKVVGKTKRNRFFNKTQLRQLLQWCKNNIKQRKKKQ